MITAHVDGARTRAALRSLSESIADAVHGQLRAGIERARVRAFHSDAFHDRTGELRSTLMSKLNANPREFMATLTALAKHARWIEEGTRAHEIKARVWHPGTKATHFMQRAVQEEDPVTRDLLYSDLRRRVQRFNHG